MGCVSICYYIQYKVNILIEQTLLMSLVDLLYMDINSGAFCYNKNLTFLLLMMPSSYNLNKGKEFHWRVSFAN